MVLGAELLVRESSMLSRRCEAVCPQAEEVPTGSLAPGDSESEDGRSPSPPSANSGRFSRGLKVFPFLKCATTLPFRPSSRQSSGLTRFPLTFLIAALAQWPVLLRTPSTLHPSLYEAEIVDSADPNPGVFPQPTVTEELHLRDAGSTASNSRNTVGERMIKIAHGGAGCTRGIGKRPVRGAVDSRSLTDCSFASSTTPPSQAA